MDGGVVLVSTAGSTNGAFEAARGADAGTELEQSGQERAVAREPGQLREQSEELQGLSKKTGGYRNAAPSQQEVEDAIEQGESALQTRKDLIADARKKREERSMAGKKLTEQLRGECERLGCM